MTPAEVAAMECEAARRAWSMGQIYAAMENKIPTFTAKEKCRIQQIVQEAADVFGVSYDETMGSRRTRRLNLARQAAMFTAYSEGFTQSEIGAVMGRDYTTVGNAVRRCRKALDAACKPNGALFPRRHLQFKSKRAEQ